MFDQVATIAKERSVRLAVAHAQVPAEMEELLAMARDRLGCEDIFQSEVGPVIGTHTGPGVLGMAVCPLEDVL
jgi:fatty acid-binding protein DegV